MRKSPSLHTLAAGAALLLAGCAPMIPPTERPALPVPEQFPQADAAAAGTTAAADLAWQEVFGDPALKQLITLALANNRDLRVAVLNIERARAQLQIRRADEFPTVGAGLTYTREPTANGGSSRLYTAGLQVTSWELDLFGRVRSLSQAALAQFFAVEEARKAAQISLVASIADAWFALRTDEALLTLTEQTLATYEDSARLVKLRFDNGVASEADLRQAESLLESARVALVRQQRQIALDRNALALLVGQPLPGDLLEPLALDDPALVRDVPAGLPSALLDRRPDLRQAERALQAANANIGAARAAMFPRITLTGSAGTASSELDGLFKSGSWGWTFAPQALLTIFDAGRNAANVEAAQVDARIALAQYERAIQSAFREVADALAGRATFERQLAAQQAQLKAEEARARLADLRYRGGVASYLEVLDAQRSLFAARQQVLALRAQTASNRVALYRTLGGGWKEPEGTR